MSELPIGEMAILVYYIIGYIASLSCLIYDILESYYRRNSDITVEDILSLIVFPFFLALIMPILLIGLFLTSIPYSKMTDKVVFKNRRKK